MASGVTSGSLACVLDAGCSTEVYWHQCRHDGLASCNHLGHEVDEVPDL